jgi:hypothetical protein
MGTKDGRTAFYSLGLLRLKLDQQIQPKTRFRFMDSCIGGELKVRMRFSSWH